MKFWIVNITSFCNHKCIFCSEWEMHNNPKNIPYNKVIEILDNLKKQWVEWVSFMWWECTMRSDLIDILDYCNKNFVFVSIVTNWVMLQNYNLCNSILSRVVTFELSWHSNDENKYSCLSGSKTYTLFQKSLSNINIILKQNKNLWIVINHVINKINYKDIPTFVEKASKILDLKDKENRMIALKWTSIRGYSINNIDLLSVTWLDISKYLKKAVEYCIKNNIYVQVEWFPPCFFKDYIYSKYFFINEISDENLYLLNKIDISNLNINEIDKHIKKDKINENFNKEIYLKWDLKLNKKILIKCKKCLLRKLCHKNILYNEDSDLLSEKIINDIWYDFGYDEIKELLIKRKNFLDKTLNWTINKK